MILGTYMALDPSPRGLTRKLSYKSLSRKATGVISSLTQHSPYRSGLTIVIFSFSPLTAPESGTGSRHQTLF